MYTINQNFQAFERTYKAGSTLTADDMLVWQPQDAQDAELSRLKAQGVISPAPTQVDTAPVAPTPPLKAAEDALAAAEEAVKAAESKTAS